jgi:hypothetical protein
VDPPADQALVNVPPLTREADLVVSAGRVGATDVWTGDLQAVLSLPEVDLPAATAGTVSVAITPHAAGELGPVPSGLAADGNAYEVAMRSGDAAMGPLVHPGRLFLAVPQAASAVLFSVDGGTWEVLDLEPGSSGQAVVAFTRPGFYLAATAIVTNASSATSASAADRGSHLSVVVAVVIAVAAVGALWSTRLRRQSRLGSAGT